MKKKHLILMKTIVIALAVIGVGIAKQFDTESLMDFGHNLEMYVMAGVFGLLLIPNIIRMFWLTVIKGKIKAPIGSYIKGFWDLF